MLFAASHPERTAALIFSGGEVKEVTTDDWPWGQSTREEFEKGMERVLASGTWGKPAPVFFAPSRMHESALMEWLGRLERSAASPAAGVAFMRMGSEIDVRRVASSIRVPTLVMHSPRDPVVQFEQGRWLARTIPDARFVELSGMDHAPWFDCVDEVISEVSEFITGFREPAAFSPASTDPLVRSAARSPSSTRSAGSGARRWA